MQQRKQLYQYAILFHPKPTKDAMGNDTSQPDEIVKDISSTLALNEQEVSIIAARQVPEKYLTNLDGIEIIVNPFFHP